MAALALTPRSTFSLTTLAPRFLQPYLRPTWSIPCEPSSSSSPSPELALEAPTRWSFPGLSSLLELLPPFVLSVPKKKTSHSRKRMKMANKWLKNRTNFRVCPGCGHVHLSHNLCPNCYSQISRLWKAEHRKASGMHSLEGPNVQKVPAQDPSVPTVKDAEPRKEAPSP